MTDDYEGTGRMTDDDHEGTGWDHPLNGAIWLNDFIKGLTIPQIIEKYRSHPKPTESIIKAQVARAVRRRGGLH